MPDARSLPAALGAPAFLSAGWLSRWFGGPPPATPLRATVELALPGDGAPEARLQVGWSTDPGCVREINEDAIRVVRPVSATDLATHGVLAVVCDGMGGHEAGEIASGLAIEAFVRGAAAHERDAAAQLVRCVEAANLAVFEAAQRDRKLAGMGTTCTGLLLRGGAAYCAHVGDSRCYLVRDGEIFLMTEDHSAVMELVRQGVITRDEARHHPDKNVISRALGSQRRVAVSAWPQPLGLRPGDRFLICSDGLYDLVEDVELRDTMLGLDAQGACDALVRLARERGGFDNISVAVLALPANDSARPVRETRAIEVAT
ncbi:MAG: Stp1/IreP family PP2C-type Ser/Thr phosphatase [Gemmatimonadaceae bacterium]|nr:Stp1/IreP family PP2C-type Ser/Thr phosphatase [Gemmatimonadaceae bacterium]